MGSQYRVPPPSLTDDSSQSIQSIGAWYNSKRETVKLCTNLESSDESCASSDEDEDRIYRGTIIDKKRDDDAGEATGCGGRGKRRTKRAPSVRHDVVYKVLVLGDTGVGKTSLIKCLAGEPFSTNNLSTIGIDFIKKTFDVDGARVQLQIWDTAGQERFRSITKFHYRGTQGLLLVYDVTDEGSLETLGYWLKSIDEDLEEDSHQPVPVFMLANKVDLEDARKVTLKTGQKVANRHCVENHLETSAKDGTNVATAFYKMAYSITEVFNKELMGLYSLQDAPREDEVSPTQHETAPSVVKRQKSKKKKKKKEKRKSIKLKPEHERKKKLKCHCG